MQFVYKTSPNTEITQSFKKLSEAKMVAMEYNNQKPAYVILSKEEQQKYNLDKLPYEYKVK